MAKVFHGRAWSLYHAEFFFRLPTPISSTLVFPPNGVAIVKGLRVAAAEMAFLHARRVAWRASCLVTRPALTGALKADGIRRILHAVGGHIFAVAVW